MCRSLNRVLTISDPRSFVKKKKKKKPIILHGLKPFSQSSEEFFYRLS